MWFFQPLVLGIFEKWWLNESENERKWQGTITEEAELHREESEAATLGEFQKGYHTHSG